VPCCWTTSKVKAIVPRMLQGLKTLSLGTMVLFAVSVGSNASAAEFNAEGSPTTLTGTQIGTDVLTLNGGTVECEEITAKGTQTGLVATSVKLAPTYTSCSALSGFASATVDMNGCEYQLNQPSGSGPTTFEGTFTIVCPAEKEITVTASSFGTSKCTIHIPPQGPLTGVVYHNEGSGATRDLTATIDLSGIKYNETAGTGFGACSGGEASNGTYEGEWTITGDVGEIHRGIWIASPPPSAEFHSEGSSTTLTGTQIGSMLFSTNGVTFECEEATYKATHSGTTITTVVASPTYSNCSYLGGFISVTIDMNGCEYQLNQPKGSGPSTYEGTFTIICPPGKEITFTLSGFGTSKCTIHIPPQGPLSGVVFHNEGAAATRDIKATIGLSGITYNETAGTGFSACPGGEASNGVYEGEATFTGEHTESGKTTHTGIWIA
jgi:hypothetical protein